MIPCWYDYPVAATAAVILCWILKATLFWEEFSSMFLICSDLLCFLIHAGLTNYRLKHILESELWHFYHRSSGIWFIYIFVIPSELLNHLFCWYLKFYWDFDQDYKKITSYFDWNECFKMSSNPFIWNPVSQCILSFYFILSSLSIQSLLSLFIAINFIRVISSKN